MNMWGKYEPRNPNRKRGIFFTDYVNYAKRILHKKTIKIFFSSQLSISFQVGAKMNIFFAYLFSKLLQGSLSKIFFRVRVRLNQNQAGKLTLTCKKKLTSQKTIEPKIIYIFSLKTSQNSISLHKTQQTAIKHFKTQRDTIEHLNRTPQNIHHRTVQHSIKRNRLP